MSVDNFSEKNSDKGYDQRKETVRRITSEIGTFRSEAFEEVEYPEMVVEKEVGDECVQEIVTTGSLVDRVMEGVSPVDALMELVNSRDPKKREEIMHCIEDIDPEEWNFEVVVKVAFNAMANGNKEFRDAAYRMLLKKLRNQIEPMTREEMLSLMGMLNAMAVGVADIIESGSEGLEGFNKERPGLDDDVKRQKKLEGWNVDYDDGLDHFMRLLRFVTQKMFDMSALDLSDDMAGELVEVGGQALRMSMDQWLNELSNLISEEERREKASYILSQIMPLAYLLVKGRGNYDLSQYIELLFELHGSHFPAISGPANDCLLSLPVKNKEIDQLKRDHLLAYMQNDAHTFSQMATRGWNSSDDETVRKWAADLAGFDSSIDVEYLRLVYIFRSGFEIPWDVKQYLAVSRYGTQYEILEDALVELNLENDEELSWERKNELFRLLWEQVAGEVTNLGEILDYYNDNEYLESGYKLFDQILLLDEHDAGNVLMSIINNSRLSWKIMKDMMILPHMGGQIEAFFEEFAEEIAGDRDLSRATLGASHYLHEQIMERDRKTQGILKLLPAIHKMGFCALDRERGMDQAFDMEYLYQSAKVVHDPELMNEILEAVFVPWEVEDEVRMSNREKIMYGEEVDDMEIIEMIADGRLGEEDLDEDGGFNIREACQRNGNNFEDDFDIGTGVEILSDAELIKNCREHYQRAATGHLYRRVCMYDKTQFSGDDMSEFHRFMRLLMKREGDDTVDFFRECLRREEWFFRFWGVEYLSGRGMLSDEELMEMRGDDVGAIATQWLRSYAFSNDQGKINQVINTAFSAKESYSGVDEGVAAVDALVDLVNNTDLALQESQEYVMRMIRDLPKQHWVREEFVKRVSPYWFNDNAIHSWEDEWEEVLY